MDIRQALDRLAASRHLSEAEMGAVMRQIMSGEAHDAQIGAFLLALRVKGETIDEITGAVRVMREMASGVAVSGDHLVDIVGTGGDGANLFNVSTASCFVVAAAGGQVAKHGNRAVSSKSGSADVLESAGIRLDLNPDQVARCVRETGVGFMFAPVHHSAMKHVIGARRALGLRTVFNILGPMTNPAGVSRQLIGVYERRLCRPMVEVLQRLGAEHVMVVHADDGLDEISLAAATHVVEAKAGHIREFQISPEDFSLDRADLEPLSVQDAAQSLALIRLALTGDGSDRARRAADVIALNAGAALYVAGLEATLAAGVERAGAVIADGSAWQRLQQLAALSQSFRADG